MTASRFHLSSFFGHVGNWRVPSTILFTGMSGVGREIGWEGGSYIGLLNRDLHLGSVGIFGGRWRGLKIICAGVPHLVVVAAAGAHLFYFSG